MRIDPTILGLRCSVAHIHYYCSERRFGGNSHGTEDEAGDIEALELLQEMQSSILC
jgi:hypothetical protein